MIAKSLRRIFIVVVLVLSATLAGTAHAQCCGTGYGYSAYYPASYSAYRPVAYTSYYGGTGWYPGYWLNRIRARLWGSPTTYVASYPSTTYASYAPTYSVGYQPAYSASYATSYAAPAAGCASCSSYSGCSSCSYTAAYAPCSSCTSGYAPCASCTTTAAQPVGQAMYQQQATPGCPSCGTGARAAQPGAVAVPGPAATQQQGAPDAGEARPELAPGEQVGPRTYRERPSNGTEQDIQPEPGSDTNGTDPYEVDSNSSTYFEAPKLFDPKDRTAQRSIAPVTTALYEKPVSYRQVSTGPITSEQAQQDASGWIGVSR